MLSLEAPEAALALDLRRAGDTFSHMSADLLGYPSVEFAVDQPIEELFGVLTVHRNSFRLA